MQIATPVHRSTGLQHNRTSVNTKQSVLHPGGDVAFLGVDTRVTIFTSCSPALASAACILQHAVFAFECSALR